MNSIKKGKLAKFKLSPKAINWIIYITISLIVVFGINRLFLRINILTQEIMVYYTGPNKEIINFDLLCNCRYPLQAKARLTSNGRSGYVEYSFQRNGEDLSPLRTLVFDGKKGSNIYLTPPQDISDLSQSSEYQITLTGIFHSSNPLLRFFENLPLIGIDYSEKFQSDPITLKCAKEFRGMSYINGGTINIQDDDCSRELTVSSFYLDQNEVSYFEYDKLELECGLTESEVLFPYRLAGMSDKEKGDHPIVLVSWEMANCFCENHGKRLPTSDEWEYIARGGIFYDSTNTSQYLKECFETFQITQISNTKEESPLSIFNINCNAYEWTNDSSSEDEYLKIVRGGGSHEIAFKNPCYFKMIPLDQKSPKVGFRCVREAK